MTRPPRPGGEPASAPVSVADAPGSSGTAGPGQHGRAGAAERPAPESPARGRSPWRMAFYGVAAVGVLIGLGWVLLGSKLLVVRSVVITGNHLVSASQVRAAAAITPGQVPMLRVDTHAAARRVESINQVQSATVSKSWPDRIVITVQERTPALAVALPSAESGQAQGTQGSGYDLIDRFGVVIRSVKTRPASLPVYQTSAVASSLRGNPAVAAAVTVLHELPVSLAGSVWAVYAKDAQDVQLALPHGVTVVWGDTSRAREKGTELTVLMRTHALYYDVSAPGTAVTK